MTDRIAKLMEGLRADPWREHTPFSPDIEAAHQVLLSDSSTGEELEEAAVTWLQKSQPCLFGRLAARRELIHFCFLMPQDLLGSDEAIQARLQAARRAWRADALEGRKSAIIVWAVSPKLATAEPDANVRALARRLLTLYLLRDVSVDEIELDDIFLRVPGHRDTLLRWPVGINYFAAHADGRWWHDHRIPGGIAFSLNSVGHLVKSGKLTTGLAGLRESLGLAKEDGEVTPIDSLDKALEFAMRTISMAADANSGKATRLIPRRGLPNDPACPIQLPPNLAGKDHCTYEGLYHTDISIPSEYFDPSPTCARSDPMALDFTYLFHRHVDNPDHETTGEGLPIAAADSSVDLPKLSKYWRGQPLLVAGAEAKAVLQTLGVSEDQSSSTD